MTELVSYLVVYVSFIIRD